MPAADPFQEAASAGMLEAVSSACELLSCQTSLTQGWRLDKDKFALSLSKQEVMLGNQNTELLLSTQLWHEPTTIDQKGKRSTLRRLSHFEMCSCDVVAKVGSQAALQPGIPAAGKAASAAAAGAALLHHSSPACCASMVKQKAWWKFTICRSMMLGALSH